MNAAALSKEGKLLIHTPHEGSKVLAIETGSISLGRAATNDLCYPDDTGLSRQHLLIGRVGPDLIVTDLGSKNGTELNSSPLTGSRTLRLGDRIKAGRVTIEYSGGDAKPPSGTVIFVDPGPSATGSESVIATNLQSVLGGTAPGSAAFAALSSSRRVVDALIRAGQELVAHRPLSELFPLVLDLSMDAVQASRGALLTISGGELVAQAAKGDCFRISTVVRDRVLRQKTSVLVVDTLTDSDFAARDSIVSQGVRSMIAAPLQTSDEVIGLLYVDLTNLTRSFTRDDLNLLTVMANIAAIRIQHAHLIELEAAGRVLARELEQAAQIQIGLLPRVTPVFPGLELAGYNLQCRTVGGDYFDYLPYERDKLALAVGDVAGKGMPAALLMASVQAHAQAIAEVGGAPADVVAKLNRAIASRCPDNRFVTFFLGVFDPRESTLSYSNAGHNPPLLLRAGGGVERMQEGGVALGMFAGMSYGEGIVPFNVGETLILYSDGVVEAARAGEGEQFEDEQFGEARLIEIVRGAGAAPLQGVIERVMEELRAWSGEGDFDDDVTLVLARRCDGGAS